ncbi:MAG: hypothetical protein M3Z27_04485 [Actinomycetota bacterium]|nr:hypothetical protein [Actinomycetota bacterium]
MGFRPEHIACSIADQLAPAIPDRAHLALTTTGSVVRLDDGQTLAAVDLATFASEEGLLSDEEAETAVRAVLSTIQDVVTEALTVMWPAPDALPAAAVRNGHLVGWFGDDQHPVSLALATRV